MLLDDPMVVGKGPIKLDPELFARDSLRIDGKTYFNDPMYSQVLKIQKHKKAFNLIIPDSLASKFVYTTKD